MTRRDPGTGTIIHLPNGRYRVQYDAGPDPDTGRRRRVSATGRTRSEARRLAQARLTALDATDPTGITLGEWLDQWLDTAIRPRKAPNTTHAYETRIRLTINPAIGRIRLDRIRPSHIRIAENRAAGPATMAMTHSILTTALRAAVAEGLLDHNPTDTVEPPERAIPDHRFLNPDQARLLINHEPDPMWRLIWRILFTLGLRVGEAAAIRPDSLGHMDDTPTLTIGWQIARLPHITDPTGLPHGMEAEHLTGSLWMTRPKTRAGLRTIPLDPGLAASLTAWAASAATPANQPMFRSRRGRPLDREAVRNAWNRALDRIGHPHIPVHSTRHTAATGMMRLGMPDAWRRLIIGHSSIDTTDRVYSHTSATDLASMIQSMAGLFTGDAPEDDGTAPGHPPAAGPTPSTPTPNSTGLPDATADPTAPHGPAS